MKTKLLFATSYPDAKAYCDSEEIPFDEVTWVLNVQLLGNMDMTGAEVHYTDLFKMMPAYEEAKLVFGK